MGSKAEKGIQILNILFQNPIITSNKLVGELNIASSTANRLLSEFEKLKIIEEYTGFRRNRKYIFKDYFELFDRKE